MRSSFRIKILKENINSLQDIVTKFCNERNIEVNFENFLSYKTGYVPDSFNYLISNSIESVILYSSKTFYQVVSDLDSDLSLDVFDRKKELEVKIELRESEEIRNIVFGFLKGDMINVFTSN